jgi:tetratricopeptide (TPR) repeat protein
MLLNRRLIEEIGLLDESFGTGNFEDDDFCLRAYLEGYRNLIAGDVFIHHYGSRTFIGNRIDYGSSLTGNREIYAGKWRAIEQEAEQGRKIGALVAMERAAECLQRGDVKGAVDLYLAAIRQCPDDPRAYRDLAAGMIQVKRYQDAVDALKAGPAGDTDAEMLTLEGYCREGLNDLATAETLAIQALSKDGSFAPALNLKGILSHKKGLLMEAEEYFKKAILQDPSYGEPFTNLGVLKWTAGERDAAFELLERGLILSPDVEDIADRYHAASTALEAFGRAENLFREARGIYPSSRHIAFLLIDLLISQDKHAEAMEEIETAMAAFDVDDGFIAAALEVRGKIGPPEIKRKAKGETLSLCMIVKNEERNLVRCLSSVKSAVDEMIVVDTGSTDRTKELAAAFGAKVFDFDWDEDFSSARNFSLSKATGDWILVIDADETVSSRDHETIRDFIKKSPAGTGGYYLTTRNYVVETNTAGWVANDGSYRGEEAGTGWYASRKVRLFRSDPRIRFSGDVHELVEAAMQNAGMKLADCGVPVHHTGKLDRASVLEKGERYYLLGLKKIEESGGTPRAILELAIQAGELGRYDDAIALWRRCLNGSPGQDECRAYVNLINACLNADRFDEALVEARKAARQANGTRELLLNCAAAEFFAGDLRKAIRMAERILKKEPDYPPALGLLAISLALAGHEERGMEYLQRLREKGLEPRSQILPAIGKLRLAGKNDQADKLLSLVDRQPQALPGPIEPFPDRSRQESRCSVQR